MNLQLTAPPERGFARLRFVLTALICGLVFTAMAAPQSVFAADAITDEDTSVTFTIPVDAGEEVRYVSNSASPAGSSASATGNQITYMPAEDFHGSGTLQYTICIIGGTSCEPAKTATITVSAVNDDPTAEDDPAVGNEAAYTVSESGVLDVNSGAIGLLGNDDDVDTGDTLTAAVDTAPTNGTIAVDPSGTFVYTPTMHFFGNDSFTYTVSDGNGGTATATAMLTVTSGITNIALEIDTTFTETLVLTPANQLITIPIYFDDRYEDIVGLNFDLEYDSTCLTFDSYTSVAVQPANTLDEASDVTTGTADVRAVKVALANFNNPQLALTDGHLADVAFMYAGPCMNLLPLESDHIEFANVIPTILNELDEIEVIGAEVPNSHSITVTVNTAANDISRFLENPSAPGSGKLAEGPVSGTHFATLTSKETDTDDPEYDGTNDSIAHTYALNAAGCLGAPNDNALVELQGTRSEEIHFLAAGTVIDYETLNQYRICVESEDPHGAVTEKRIFIAVEDQDEAPTAIKVDDANDAPDMGELVAPGPLAINENLTDTLVATLSVTDTEGLFDTGVMSHTYHILSVTSTAGAAPTTTFVITDNELYTGLTCCDHEAADSYDILVRAYDVYDQFAPGFYTTPTLMIDAVVTVNITDVNEMPAGVTPIAYSVAEDTIPGTPLSPVVTTNGDPDSDESHTYTLVGAAGSTCTGPIHNGRFAIDEDSGEISTNAFMLATGPGSGPGGVYTICVRSTDSGGLFVDTEVEISVTDSNLPPVTVDDTLSSSEWIVIGSELWSVDDSGPGSITPYGPVQIDILDNDFDPNGDPFVVQGPYNVISQTLKMGEIVRQGSYITYSAPSTTTAISPADYAGTDTFTYMARDNQGAPNNISEPATVSVPYVLDFARGDCNADGMISSADFTLGVQEYFESSSVNWNEIHINGSFAGSPWGCNSIRDLSIDINDVVCTVQTFLQQSCSGSVQASSLNSATLSIGADLAAAPGETINVPITFTNNGDGVAIGFFVDINTEHLAFDASDLNGDGMPDAINLDQLADMDTYFNYDEATGELRFAALDVAFRTMTDGTLATIALQVKDNAQVSQSDIQLTETSLSNANAQDVPMSINNASVSIRGTSNQSSLLPEVYLPLLIK